MKFMKCAPFVALLLTLVSFNSSNIKIIILDYEDFGPQAMAYETLGYSWYEWDSHGGEEETHNVKVVVYEGKIEAVKKLYKDDKSKPVDYRFITKTDALNYFKKAIADVKNMPLPELLQKLKSTQTKLSRE